MILNQLINCSYLHPHVPMIFYRISSNSKCHQHLGQQATIPARDEFLETKFVHYFVMPQFFLFVL